MPRKFKQPHHFRGGLHEVRKEVRMDSAQRQAERISELMPGYIGRSLQGGYDGSRTQLRRTLREANATMYPEIFGLAYINATAIRRNIGKTIFSRQDLYAQIDSLGEYAHQEIVASRGEIELLPITAVQPGHAAFVIRSYVRSAYSHDGSHISLKDEKARLEEHLQIEPNHTRTPKLNLGIVEVPTGSGAEADIQYAYDELFPDKLALGWLRYKQYVPHT